MLDNGQNGLVRFRNRSCNEKQVKISLTLGLVFKDVMFKFDKFCFQPGNKGDVQAYFRSEHSSQIVSVLNYIIVDSFEIDFLRKQILAKGFDLNFI